MSVVTIHCYDVYVKGRFFYFPAVAATEDIRTTHNDTYLAVQDHDTMIKMMMFHCRCAIQLR
jgi:hypothetical protein